jgi:hypothetical protein
MERLEDAGLLGKEKWLSGNLPGDGKFDNALEDIDSGFEVDAAFDD